ADTLDPRAGARDREDALALRLQQAAEPRGDATRAAATAEARSQRPRPRGHHDHATDPREASDHGQRRISRSAGPTTPPRSSPPPAVLEAHRAGPGTRLAGPLRAAVALRAIIPADRRRTTS